MVTDDPYDIHPSSQPIQTNTILYAHAGNSADNYTDGATTADLH